MLDARFSLHQKSDFAGINWCGNKIMNKFFCYVSSPYQIPIHSQTHLKQSRIRPYTPYTHRIESIRYKHTHYTSIQFYLKTYSALFLSLVKMKYFFHLFYAFYVLFYSICVMLLMPFTFWGTAGIPFYASICTWRFSRSAVQCIDFDIFFICSLIFLLFLCRFGTHIMVYAHFSVTVYRIQRAEQMFMWMYNVHDGWWCIPWNMMLLNGFSITILSGTKVISIHFIRLPFLFPLPFQIPNRFHWCCCFWCVFNFIMFWNGFHEI